jgi:glutaminyl-peptide cyclotransferase
VKPRDFVVVNLIFTTMTPTVQECDNVHFMKKRTVRRSTVEFLLAFALLLAGYSAAQIQGKKTPEYSFKVVHAYPHDPNAFTQGLIYHDGFLYEGTGLEGRSSLRKVRLETGEILQQTNISAKYFGEGIAVFKNEVVQITWQSHVGFVYDLGDFHPLRQFSYPGEGWGLTTNGNEFFMSDGTAQIRVLDADTFKEKRRIKVHEGAAPIAAPIKDLNELEFVEGEIYANVWQTDRIARISPQTGEVLGWIDLTGLLGPMYRLEDGAVLNGIAYDAQRKRLFVTGKLWPKLFEIQIVPKP